MRREIWHQWRDDELITADQLARLQQIAHEWQQSGTRSAVGPIAKTEDEEPSCQRSFFFSAPVCIRILQPLLADIAWEIANAGSPAEARRIKWHGYWTIATTVAAFVFSSTFGRLLRLSSFMPSD